MLARFKTGWRQARRDRLLGAGAGVLVFCAAMVVFVVLANAVHAGGHLALENRVMHSLRTDDSRPIGPHWLANAARDVTALGSTAVLTLVVALAAGYLALERRWTASIFVIVVMLGGLGLNHALKSGFGRQRPEETLRLVEIDSLSFPSGHAMLSVTVYLTLALTLSRLATGRRRRLYLMSAATMLSFLVGVSRVYLGVHFPSDVIGGWAVGVAWASLCWSVAHLVHRWRSARTSTDLPAVHSR